MYGQCVVCWGEGGVPQLVHPEGGCPSWSIQGGSTSVFTSGGGPLPCSLLGGGGPLLCSLPGGPFPYSLLGGVPCDLFHNALIYCYRTPQCIMGKIHMGPPPPTSMFTSRRGAHVTYPIMLLYTTIECPSASWAKFTSAPPRV